MTIPDPNHILLTPAVTSPSEAVAAAAVAAFNAPTPGYFDRTLGAFARRVIVFVRQSSMRQVKSHKHSLDVQLKQIQHFDVPEDRIKVIRALGESGMADTWREHFEEMLRLLDTGEFGVVSVARHDRTGRDDFDNKRLLDALVRNRAVLMVDGHVFDPSVPEDKMILGIYGVFAEYENQLRSRWMRLTALAAAKRLALRIRVPSPFLWASPDDPEYVEALRRAGLAEWLEDLPAEPTAGRAFSRADGRRYFPLPVPDSVAFGAAQTLLRFIRESDSVAEAVQRTMRDPDWPDDHRGEFPVVRARLFGKGTTLVEWVPIDRDPVAEWAMRPALRGEYVYESEALGRKLAPEDRGEVRVSAPDAFRGLLTPEQAARVAAVVRSGVKRRLPAVDTRHVLPLVYCSHVLEGGSVCGARLYPGARRGGGGRRYASDVCKLRGHVSSVPGELDGVVLDTFVDALSDIHLEAHLDERRFAATSSARERTTLEDQLRHARGRQDSAAEEVLLKKEAGDEHGASYWRDKQSGYALEVRRLEADVARLVADTDLARALSAHEAGLVRRLATDLPQLVRELRDEPVLARRLLRDAGVVVHVRSPGKYAYYVELAFPTATRVGRWVFSQHVPSTQPLRVFAAACLAAGASAEDTAAAVRPLLPPQDALWWDARRVHGAALRHVHAERETPREGEHISIGDLAVRVDERLPDVLRAALLGTLGPARAVAPTNTDGAMLEVAPTEPELHAAFPKYACRETAGQQPDPWPITDTVRMADAARIGWELDATIYARARAPGGGGVARDLAGRSYVRLSKVTVPEIVDAAKAALRARPELAGLDPARWVPVGSGRMKGAEWELLALHAPTVTVPTAKAGETRTFAWVGASVLKAAATAALASAVANSPSAGLRATDFHPAEHVLARLRVRAGAKHGMLQRQLRSGRHVPVVYALAVVHGGLRRVRYVHVPRSVYNTKDVHVVKRWLDPSHDPLKLERRVRRRLRARVAPDRAACADAEDGDGGQGAARS